jgi:hypothetical protein
MKSHKLIACSSSRYLHKILTSGMQEGRDSTIRLTTVYPKSLHKLLLSFYDHVLEISSATELIEMLYLADEYDMPEIMTALRQVLEIMTEVRNVCDSTVREGDLLVAKENCWIQQHSSRRHRQNLKLRFRLTNASQFLSCSARLNLNLAPAIFAGLAKDWVYFGPGSKNDHRYELHKRKCNILLDSLNFTD